MKTFENLKKYHHIFVVGPQRSGTRGIARMIASDTGHIYIDEKKFLVDSLHQFQNIVWEHQAHKIVVQCPGITRWIHKLAGDDDLVVFCWRVLRDVLDSQEKFWTKDKVESLKYDRESGSAAAKQEYWSKIQRRKISFALTLKFPEDVEDHPMYVPKEKRSGWAWDQTEKKT